VGSLDGAAFLVMQQTRAGADGQDNLVLWDHQDQAAHQDRKERLEILLRVDFPGGADGLERLV